MGMMQNNQPVDMQLLSGLKDIHLPAPAPWWDLPLAWWIILLVSLVLLVWGLPKALLWLRKKRQQRLLKQAMQATFEQIKNTYQQQRNQQKLLADISVLLRQVVLTLFADKNKAGLIGKHWFEFLDSLWKNKPELVFQNEKIMLLLADASYRQHIEVAEKDIQLLLQLVESWLSQVQKHV